MSNNDVRAYNLGYNRGAQTGRHDVQDKDVQWCAEQTEGEIQLTDPSDYAAFAKGMKDGAPEYYG